MTKSQEIRWKAELEIIQELGRVPSSREMQQLLQEKKGLIVNHNTVNTDLKKDLESLTESEYENRKSGILSMLDNLVSVANSIATSDPDNNVKLKAMSTLTKLSKTQSDILIKFRKANADLAKTEQPIYEVVIGNPNIAKSEESNEKNDKEIEDVSSSDTEEISTDE